jgi:hypothetical protein
MRTLLTVFVLLPLSMANAECLHYSFPEIQLQGRFYRGELVPTLEFRTAEQLKDNSYYYWWIELTDPVCLRGDEKGGNLAVSDIRDISVNSPEYQLRRTFDRYDGVSVKITGHFVPTHMPHYHTATLFSISAIEYIQ